MKILKSIIDQFNFAKQCREYRINLWQCPQFLFLIMGLVIILSIILTNFVAQKFAEPEIVVLIVLIVTAILFIINFTIVSSFERIARSSKQKSEFISIMSHRLRSPLSSIKWQIDLILGKKSILNEEQTETVLTEIQKQNEKMIRIVNDLLELNRVEDRSLILNPSGFSLKEVVDEVIQSERENAEQAGVEIFVSAPEILPDVFADKARIRNVIFHLIDNAIRYSVNGGKVTVSLDKFEDRIRCAISDEGAGISEKETKKVFTKFFRNEDTFFYQTEGSGIGLFIAKAITELSGGKIGFNSIEGRGSTFWLTLPITNIKYKK